MSIWQKSFWKATAERAISSAAGGALTAIGTGLVGVLDINAVGVLSIAGGTALVSVLKALAASKLGDGGPSLTSAETVTPTGYDAKHDA